MSQTVVFIHGGWVTSACVQREPGDPCRAVNPDREEDNEWVSSKYAPG